MDALISIKIEVISCIREERCNGPNIGMSNV